MDEIKKYKNPYKTVDVRNLLLEIENCDELSPVQKSLIYSIGLRIGYEEDTRCTEDADVHHRVRHRHHQRL